MAHAVTFPFFAEQIRFREMDVAHKAKYLLFFVTEVIKLREDGMEIAVIAERLKDRFGGAVNTDSLKEIQAFFDEGGDNHEIRRYDRDGTTVAYKILANSVESLLRELEIGLRIFISYKSGFSANAERISRTLEGIGVKTWLDLKDLSAGNIHRNIDKGMSDSCLAVFVVTDEFEDRTWIGREIELALQRKITHQNRFEILPIQVRAKGKDAPRVPEVLANVVAYKTVDAADGIVDLEIVRYIVEALPVKLGVTQWKAS